MIALLTILRWLTGNGGLTLATWGLVVATFFLYRDSRQKGREQRERWQREDERQKENNKPKFVFGVDLDTEGAYFWIANIGLTTFLLKTIFLNRTPIGEDIKVPAPGRLDEVVPVGSKRIFRLEKTLLTNAAPETADDISAEYKCEISCSVIGADGQQVTSPKRNFVTIADKTGRLDKHQQTKW